jgi:hypothetical protein
LAEKLVGREALSRLSLVYIASLVYLACDLSSSSIRYKSRRESSICVAILRNFVPGLWRGARIVVTDPHTPAPRCVQEAGHEGGGEPGKRNTTWLQDRLARWGGIICG